MIRLKTMTAIVEKIQSNLRGRCLPRVLAQHCDAMGNNCYVDCIVREFVPVDSFTSCDAARGRQDVPMGVQAVQDVNGHMMHACDITPVPTNGGMPAAGTGWYYDTSTDASDPTCRQRINFTMNATPQAGSITRLECIQSVTGVTM